MPLRQPQQGHFPARLVHAREHAGGQGQEFFVRHGVRYVRSLWATSAESC